jgi:hypothetical protein
MYPDRDITLIQSDRPQDEQQEDWIRGAIDLIASEAVITTRLIDSTFSDT